MPGQAPRYGIPRWQRASHNPDRHVRQALELAQQHVALHHRADILRRAGIDDVTRLQLERFRELRDLLGDAPDHLAEVRTLLHRAIDRERDGALLEVTGLANRMDRA